MRNSIFYSALTDENGNILVDENGNKLLAEIGITDTEVFQNLTQAYMPKNEKIIKDIIIQIDDDITVEQLSEGEKKLILVKTVLEILSDEKTLVLMDEPDAHLHEGRKPALCNMMREYPNRQIVIATHSPIMAQIANEKELLMLELENGKSTILTDEKIEKIKKLSGTSWDVIGQGMMLRSSRPLVVFEGKTDVMYVKRALEMLKSRVTDYASLNVDFLNANGAGNVKSFIDNLKAFVPDSKKIVVFFDRDNAGKDGVQAITGISKNDGRVAHYQDILAMTEEEFLEYISKLWSMLIWGNKKYVVDKMIADNGFAMLKKQLAELLYSTNPIEKRWDVFLKSIKGMGPATISELLTYANPQEYVIFNKTTILCYGYLDIPDMPKYNYQYTGKKYAEVCAIAKKIAAELKKAGADDYDLLAVDYFMWDEILPLAEKKSPVSPATPEVKKPVTVKDSKSLHDEIKEKLVAIGELLGFDSRSEVKITTGAVVDAVWEAKIGNMGKAIYVFEVQSKGSIDSLILNLKKAQSNAAVQAVVAVADEEQLAKIIRESAGVIDEKSLRTWDSEDVLAVYDSLVRAHESINKLALVPESF